MRFIGIAGILLSVFMMVKPFDIRNSDCGSAIFPEWNHPSCEDEINERRVIYGVVGIFGLGVFFFGGNLINTGRVTGVKEDEDKQQ